jgi:GTP-binding protein HflX
MKITLTKVPASESKLKAGDIVDVTGAEADTLKASGFDYNTEAEQRLIKAREVAVDNAIKASRAFAPKADTTEARETALALDRRKIRDRISELKDQLEAVQRDSDQRRIARRDQLRVALVGYTNAGKSSLMRALTGSQVLVEDKLFATLDTTVRILQPETRPRILVSDTVGFIKQLPHDLVASFRSTLAEALEASLLLYVVDASDPTYEAQLEVSRSVLREIGADAVPSCLVLNKMDRLDAPGRAALLEKHPDAILLSAHIPADVAALRETMIGFFEAMMVEGELVVPYARQNLIGDVYDSARVLSESYDETGRVLQVRGLPGAIARLQRSLAAP